MFVIREEACHEGVPMSAAAVPDIRLNHDVNVFLKKHNAKAAFEKVIALVRECYPNCLDLSLRLLDDPDTEDRQWLVIDVTFPESAPLEFIRSQDDAYHQRLVTEVPLEYCPLFAVTSHSIAD
jgi:hypothetical protein